MKIKTRPLSFEELQKKPPLPHWKPQRPWFLLRVLILILSLPALWATRFTFTRRGMERAGKGPYLILMNHSGFLDMKIAARILFPLSYHIVSTADAYVGKSFLMPWIGCIPTQKFVTDVTLVMDLFRVVKKKKRSVLMYPEAGYSLDGTATTLPRRLGGLLKRLDVPVLMIRSDAGVFLRNPLYNCLRLRKVRTSAELSCLLTREEIREKSVAELDAVLDEAFSFDHFAEQREKDLRIREEFRAEGLEKVLYRCPHCGAEGKMQGVKTSLTCLACGQGYTMEENGVLRSKNGETVFSHVPDWFAWQRECVRREVEEGTYRMDFPVKIGVLTDAKCLYLLGEGRLRHDASGLTLTSENGEFTYTQSPFASHSLNVDFFWYEMGDVVGLGSKERLYYCFPTDHTPVCKARLAAEEIYRLGTREGKVPEKKK